MAKTKVHGEYLDPSVISGQTQVTAVGADSVLILDATDNALKKALLSDVIETVGSTPSFTSATISGDLTVDTTTLKVDSSNNRVGVGTATPSTKLHLGGTAPLDSIIRQDSTSSGTNWEIGERAAGKWQIFEDDNDSIVATFKSDGKVGIGTESPATELEVKAASGYAELRLQGASGSSGSLEFYDATTKRGDLYFDTSDNFIVRPSGTERMRIAADGTTTIGRAITTTYDNDQGYPLHIQASGGSQTYLAISMPSDNSGDTGLVLGHDGTGSRIINRESQPIMFHDSSGENLRILAGGGLTFNGDTAAANALNDYEEGTWTPTMSGGASISLSSANYVKVGRFLHANCYFTFSGLANDGNVFKIDGLPFNCTSGNHYGGGVISYTHAANTNDLTPLVQTGDNYIYFHELDGTSAVVTNANIYSRFANGAGYILLNMYYMTI